MALATPAVADAQNVVTINIDNPEAVTVTKEHWDSDLGQNVAEDVFNPLEMVNQYTYATGAYEYLYIRPKEDYKLVSVLNNGQDALYGSTYCSISCSDYTNGAVITVTTASLADIRTATATFNIDDASKVRMSRGGSGGEITNLVNGENKIKFDPNTESRFEIGSKEYNNPIYQVKLAGEIVPESYGRWTVSLEDGSVVDIQAAWPNESHLVKINVPAEYPDIITDVRDGNYTVIEGDFTQGVMVKSGTSINIQCNNAVYSIDKFLINGVPEANFSGSWSGRMRDTDLTFDVEGHPYGTFDVTLNINDPKLVKAYKASYNDPSAQISLVAGDNTITYQESQGGSYYLYLEPASGNVFNTYTIRHAGSEEAEEITARMLTVAAGDVITVVSGPRVRDQKLHLLVDEAAVGIISELKISYTDFSTPNYDTVELYKGVPEAGMTTVNYSATELPFNLYITPVIPNPVPENFTPEIPYIFINDLSEGQTQSVFFTSDNLNDGDIIRIYKEQPTLATVTVTVADDTDAKNFAITCDGQPVDWAEENSFTAFTGANVAVKWTAPEVEEGFYMTHTCSLDNEPLEADADGVCSFKVADAAHTLLLAEQKNVGISNVDADAVAADEAVYNLQGIRVATASELNRLPAGIYICGGKKTIVK